MNNKIVGANLYPHQQALINLYDKHPKGSIICIKSCRQSGKSFTINQLILKECINNKKFRVVVICPSYQLCKQLFGEVESMIVDIPKLTTSINKSNFEITFFNKSTVQWKSIESGNRLRGDHCSLLVIEEAAFCDKATAEECFAYTNVQNSDVLLISTPKFKDENDLFYCYYSKALRGEPNCYHLNFTDYDLSMLLTPEKKEFYKRTLPKNIYLNEIEGQFLSNESELFNLENVLYNGAIPDNQMVMGIDWCSGTNNDNTAISIFNSFKQMVALHTFNDKDANATIQYIIDILKEGSIKKCIVETNSIGKPMLDFLRKQISSNHIRVQIIEFQTSNSSKREIMEQLILEIQNKTITLLDNFQLKNEFMTLVQKRTPSGLVTYSAIDGYHDDVPMSVCLALYGLKSGSYCIR